MTVFTETLPLLREIVAAIPDVSRLGLMVVNRDLNGRVRLIVEDRLRTQPESLAVLQQIANQMADRLGPHAFPPDRAVLFEPISDLRRIYASSFPLSGIPSVRVIDRLITDSDWATITPPTLGKPRIVFFSVHESEQSAMLYGIAQSLAQRGKRLLVLDLKLNAPSISALIPAEHYPQYGIADWLVEDLVENGDEVLPRMVATIAANVLVVPAYGRDLDSCLVHLGRRWMPKITHDGRRESWAERLARCLDALEYQFQADAIIVDAPAGLDEQTAACVTSLGATMVLGVVSNTPQAWMGWQILRRHWEEREVVDLIRHRLQMVGIVQTDADRQAVQAYAASAGWNPPWILPRDQTTTTDLTPFIDGIDAVIS